MQSTYNKEGLTVVMCSKQKLNYELDLHKELRMLKSTKPKEYWKILNSGEEVQNSQCNISLNCFTEHFKNFSKTGNSNTECVSTSFDRDLYFSSNLWSNEEINKSFTINEVLRLLSGADSIINEFIKNSPTEFVLIRNISILF